MISSFLIPLPSLDSTRYLFILTHKGSFGVHHNISHPVRAFFNGHCPVAIADFIL